jgi:hypothetical protein
MAEVNLPITLYASVTSITPVAQWNQANGPNDPYLGYDYQWSIIMLIEPQYNGDFSNNFQYDETSVHVGDWVVLTSGSFISTVQIISISAVGAQTLVCTVEDVDRYNQYFTGNYGINDVSPSGVYDALIVRLGEDGLAIITGVTPYSVPVNTQSEVDSRFRFRNYLQSNYRTYQLGNTFTVGDEISLNVDGTYSLANAVGASAYNVIGRIKDVDIPGNGWFTYEPKGKLVRYITPSLPGSPGSVIYLDPNNPGKLTATNPNVGVSVPIFIQINSSTAIKLDEILNGSLDNFNATVAPIATDDSTAGYGYGSIWIDRTHQKSYINVNPGVGSSVWQLIGSSDVTIATTRTLGSVIIGSNINVDNTGVISVSKGAGINKVIDIPDVYSRDISDGALLTYNQTTGRWNTSQLGSVSLDGGEF